MPVLLSLSLGLKGLQVILKPLCYGTFGSLVSEMTLVEIQLQSSEWEAFYACQRSTWSQSQSVRCFGSTGGHH